jgi:hypothetical protein
MTGTLASEHCSCTNIISIINWQNRTHLAPCVAQCTVLDMFEYISGNGVSEDIQMP